MIDWALVHFPLTHEPIRSGEVVSINPDGTVDWVTPKRAKITGSYEKSVAVKSLGGNGLGQSTHIWFNGNPSKFLQGHNVFGSDDIVSLLKEVYFHMVKELGLSPTKEEIQQVEQGDYPLKMVDINYSYSLPSQSDVQSFIRASEYKSKTRQGRPSNKSGTLYFNKTSEYWSLKFYSKHEEINTKRGAIPEQLKNRGIESWAENKLRVEVRLRSKELQRLEIKTAKDLTANKVWHLFSEYLGKIEMTEQIQLNDEILLSMPNKLRLTYTAWLEGHNLRDMMSKATYHRHRNELKQFGINIDLRPETTQKTNVVPLIRILEAKPASNPEWAHQEGLIHHSAVANY